MKAPVPILIGAVACDCFERGKSEPPPSTEWDVYLHEDGRPACRNPDPVVVAQFLEWRENYCDCKHGSVAYDVMFEPDVLLSIKSELEKHPTVFPYLLSVFLDSPLEEKPFVDRETLGGADWRELDLVDKVQSGSRELDLNIREFGKRIQKLIVTSGVFQKPIIFFKFTPTGPGALAVSCMGDVWDSIDFSASEEEFLRQFADADEVGRTLFAAYWCQAEVHNGGFAQFFRNSTGMLAPEALDAFVSMNLHACADALRSAMAYFGPSYPRDRLLRLVVLPSADATSVPSPFASLDVQFCSAGGGDQDYWMIAADEYVLRNSETTDEP